MNIPVDPIGQSQRILLQNQQIPMEGPLALGINLDFSVNLGYTIDLLNLIQTGQISMIQTIYVDNHGNTQTLLITMNGSGQTVEIGAKTQGYYAVLCPNPAKLAFVASATIATGPVQVFLINVPIAGVVWAAA